MAKSMMTNRKPTPIKAPQMPKGNLSPTAAAKIRAKANKALGK